MPLASPRWPWGWTAPARGGLTFLAAVGALGLLAVSPGVDGPTPDAPQLVVDPNGAPPGVLGALPKLGPALVSRMIEAREEAPFRSLDDLDARVRGIGPATAEALRAHLRFDPAEGPGETPLPAPP